MFRRRFDIHIYQKRRFVFSKATTNTVLTADGGSLVLSGGVAVFTISQTSTGQALALTGGSAALSITQVSSGGTLALTGGSATLVAQVDVTLTADPGVLVLTGGEASLIATDVKKGGGEDSKAHQIKKPGKRPPTVVEVYQQKKARQTIKLAKDEPLQQAIQSVPYKLDKIDKEVIKLLWEVEQDRKAIEAKQAIEAEKLRQELLQAANDEETEALLLLLMTL